MRKITHSLIQLGLFFMAILIILWLVLARPLPVSKLAINTNGLVDVTYLKNTVIFLSQTSLPRDSNHPQNLDRIADFLKTEFSKTSAQVNFQKFSIDGVEYKNVIANFGPDTNEVIVIGAHYDAYSTHPAADDNASGVAALLAVGKLLQHTELKHRVILAAYTLEEPPYFGSENMGSFIHASSLHEQGKAVTVMIAFDMLGYYSNEPGSQHFPLSLLNLFYPTKGNFIAIVDKLQNNTAVSVKAAVNKYTDLPAYSINAPLAIPGIDFSDHRNFWHFGYPAVEVTDTSFYRNHAYHQEEDTIDKLNFENIAKITYGVFKYLEEMDKK